MKKLSLALSLAFVASAFADVPALINYQGRLVDGVGNPVTGSKAFKIDIYDSQTEGTLIYQETLPDITLDEDGAYSFQFGAGVSRTETSEIVATGDGETMLFQTRLEQTPFGPITVTDGTNSFTQGDVATGEEPFTFLYVRGANRINLVCNDPPATGVSFTATYRYNEAGIVGALGTAAEHWMEVTIGGEKQEPRQRLVAVPFALRALDIIRNERRIHLNTRWTDEFGRTLDHWTQPSQAGDYQVRNLNPRNERGKTISSRRWAGGPTFAYRYLDNLGDAKNVTGIELNAYADRDQGNMSLTLQYRIIGSPWQTALSSKKTLEKSGSIKILSDGLLIPLEQNSKEWRVIVEISDVDGEVFLHDCNLRVK
jgi:hypothetical protein